MSHRNVVTMTLKYIWISSNESINLSRVGIVYCKLENEDVEDKRTECSKLQLLQKLVCHVSEQCFCHICN